MLDHVFWDENNYYTKIGWPLGIKGLGLILGFCPITSEDFWPLTQQIGLASKCTTILTAIVPFVMLQCVGPRSKFT